MKTFSRHILLALILCMALSLFALPSAEATYYVKQVFERTSATCGQALSTGDAVALYSTDGYAYKADADNSSARPALGVAGKSCASGGKVEIITSGILSGWSSLTIGAAGYLSETAGAITQATPSYSQQLGIAITATDYYISPKNYFDTSAVTALGVLSGATPLIFEGSAVDDNETTFAITNPTADRTITFPDSTGTVALLTGTGSYKTFTTLNDNTTLTSADCGKVIGMGTDNKSITLPSSVSGCVLTFINTGAAGNNNVWVTPAAADNLSGSVDNASGFRTVINGAAGEAIKNTTATSKPGDSVTIIGDGALHWFIVNSKGIWAELTP